jgi:hypothetical protein
MASGRSWAELFCGMPGSRPIKDGGLALSDLGNYFFCWMKLGGFYNEPTKREAPIE